MCRQCNVIAREDVKYRSKNLWKHNVTYRHNLDLDQIHQNKYGVISVLFNHYKLNILK